MRFPVLTGIEQGKAQPEGAASNIEYPEFAEAFKGREIFYAAIAGRGSPLNNSEGNSVPCETLVEMSWKRNTRGLRPWKRGTSGNPRGRPPGLGRAIGLLPRQEFEELVTVLLRGTMLDAERIAKSKTRPPIQVMIAKALCADAKRGRFGTLDRLLNHIIGRPK